MVYVPGGEFKMGRDDGDKYEGPAHNVSVNPFFIDINEVTRAQYHEFINKTGHAAPANWSGKQLPSGTGQLPVTDVSWGDADAYAKWAGKRLPTEEEWEFAARGPKGPLYPWGNDWQQGSANANGATKTMADVGTHKGTSPFGAYDMVGNAWEWTDSRMRAYPGGKLPETTASNLKVLRGGSYKSNRTQATTTYRFGWRASGEASYAETGFRCAKDIANNAK